MPPDDPKRAGVHEIVRTYCATAEPLAAIVVTPAQAMCLQPAVPNADFAVFVIARKMNWAICTVVTGLCAQKTVCGLHVISQIPAWLRISQFISFQFNSIQEIRHEASKFNPFR